MPPDPPLSPELLASLAASTAPRALLLRHSDRHDAVDGNPDDAATLTAVGERRARALGAALGAPVIWAVTSPLRRCTDTAALMGATPVPSHLLGKPGPFVIDSAAGGRVFRSHGTDGVVRGQIRGQTWGCMRPLAEGARLVLTLLRTHLAANPGTGVAVSHDAIVMPFIAWATGYDFADDWLAPLDGVVVTAGAVVWRGQRFEVPP